MFNIVEKINLVLNEEYLFSKEYKNYYFLSSNRKRSIVSEFFINPSSKEMKEVNDTLGFIRGIRGIADNSKKVVIIWTSTLLHEDVIKDLNEKGYGKSRNNTLKFSGFYYSGKIKIDYCDLSEYDKEELLAMLDINWKWVRKWILDVNYISKEIKIYLRPYFEAERRISN